jgi:Tfp pilus assembly protein PilN
MAKHFRFNLLIKKERAVLSEAVTFLNSYAKYVIVITQILVLFVFFIKIILDQTVIDLKETIDQKNQIILTAKEMIDNNNLLAKKLKLIATILKTNDYRYKNLNTILKNIPNSIKINNITLQADVITLEGEGKNPIDIQKLQLNLSNKIDGTVKVNEITKNIGVYSFKLDISHEEQQT